MYIFFRGWGVGGVGVVCFLLVIKNSFKRSIPMTKRLYMVDTCIDYSDFFFGKLAIEKSKLFMPIFTKCNQCK